MIIGKCKNKNMLRITQSLRYVQSFGTCHKRSIKQLVDILPEVQQALQNKQPVVALESTIITHGMPYPQNIQTAQEVEEIVRNNGATPATIAILNGRIKVGLEKEELARLAQEKFITKCSRRDLAYILAKQQSGGTTVAATMILANMVGLRIFATGGIGGVHRDGHLSMDVSADLMELGRTPVAVVCSGVKSILDIPRTLEYLETQGVCALTYGSKECNFPDFYTRESGCKVPYNVNNALEAAQLIHTSRALNLQSSLLFAVPIPEKYEADKKLIKQAIDDSYHQAHAEGIKGKEVTPFLLAAIAKITQGSSLAANMALIKNNAKVAAQIANKLSLIETEGRHTSKKAPLVIGASIMDLSLTITEEMPDSLNGATYHTQSKQTAGGVGRNLAEGIFKLFGDVNFISVVGADHMGKSLLEMMPTQIQKGISVNKEVSTSLCSVIFDIIGDCRLILGNMEIHNFITPQLIKQQEDVIKETPLLIMDANLSLPAMETTLELAAKYQKPVFFEPTDMRIAYKPFSLAANLQKQIKLISPNIFELKAIVEILTKQKINWQPNIKMNTDQLLAVVKPLLLAIQANFDCILVTLGPHGVLLSIRGEQTSKFELTGADVKLEHTVQHYAAPKVKGLTNVSGAGDSFSSGFITGLLRNYEIERAVALGFIAAERALKSTSAVPSAYFTDKEQQLQEVNKRCVELQRQTV